MNLINVFFSFVCIHFFSLIERRTKLWTKITIYLHNILACKVPLLKLSRGSWSRELSITSKPWLGCIRASWQRKVKICSVCTGYSVQGVWWQTQSSIWALLPQRWGRVLATVERCTWGRASPFFSLPMALQGEERMKEGFSFYGLQVFILFRSSWTGGSPNAEGLLSVALWWELLVIWYSPVSFSVPASLPLLWLIVLAKQLQSWDVWSHSSLLDPLLRTETYSCYGESYPVTARASIIPVINRGV